MILDPKNGGVIFSNIFDPPPPPHFPQNFKKVGFKWGGGSGGVRTKNSLGDVFIGQNNDFTRVKLTIQPLGAGYANRPKKAQNEGYVVFSPIYACLALI